MILPSASKTSRTASNADRIALPAVADMDVAFQLARLWDQELLIGLMRQLRECDLDEGAFDEDAARQAIPALLSDPSVGRIWLIKDGERTVGYVALTLCYSIEFGGRIAFIDEVF